MNNSVVYGFLLNMWVARKVDEEYLNAMVAKGRLTQEEKDMIMVSPQLEAPQM
jgi:hypothetical protein